MTTSEDPIDDLEGRDLPLAARQRLEGAAGRAAPALTYAFLHADGAVSTFVAGRADASVDSPLEAREPVPLYSMTKAVTALATLELLARHGVAIDTDVRELLSSFPFRQHRVSVGDLLCHTSGLPLFLCAGYTNRETTPASTRRLLANAPAHAHTRRHRVCVTPIPI
jgi:CubicO group peptidase (beta-lactamase class C family)